MEIEFDVRGIEDLERALRAIDEQLAPAALTEALLDAAKPMVQRAKELAPVETGKLRRSIRAVAGLSRRARRSLRFQAAVRLGRVGASGKYSGRALSRAEAAEVDALGAGVVSVTANARYAHLVEFGHAGVKVKRGFFLTRKTVTHIVPAHPFMRPAFDTAAPVVAERFKSSVMVGLRKAWAKRGAA